MHDVGLAIQRDCQTAVDGEASLPAPRGFGARGRLAEMTRQHGRTRGASRLIARSTTHFDDPTLQADWTAIARTGGGTVFQARNWLNGIIRHFSARLDFQPFFITICTRADGQPIAIFPLMRRREFGLTIIEYLGGNFCDTQAPILAQGDPVTAASAGELADALHGALPQADIIRLRRMPATIDGGTNPFCLLPGVRNSHDSSWPVDLSCDQPTSVTQTSAYKTYQKQWRKLSRREGIDFQIFETPQDIAEAYERMVAMRRARFADLDRDDLLRDESVVAFYRDMALLPPGAREVSLAGLRVGEDWVAYIYMLSTGGRFSTIISAIDNSVGNAYAPALILFTKIFEHAIAQRYSAGDMGIGAMHYKTRFSSGPNPLFIWERGLTVTGRIALSAQRLQRTAANWARRHEILMQLKSKWGSRPALSVRAPETGAAEAVD